MTRYRGQELDTVAHHSAVPPVATEIVCVVKIDPQIKCCPYSVN